MFDWLHKLSTSNAIIVEFSLNSGFAHCLTYNVILQLLPLLVLLCPHERILFIITRETVATETPANFATSRIVATSSPLNMVIDYKFTVT